MLLIALIIARSQRVCCHCQCLGRQPELTAGERGHHPSLLVSLLCIITVLIMITWPKPRYVRQGLAGGIAIDRGARIQFIQAGTFWAVLNVSLCASSAQLGLGIVVQIIGDSKLVD